MRARFSGFCPPLSVHADDANTLLPTTRGRVGLDGADGVLHPDVL